MGWKIRIEGSDQVTMWKHAPKDYGPPKTLYNRWKRCSRMGVFATIMTELAAQAQDTEMVMIDATHLKTPGTASSLAAQRGRGRLIGRTKGGLNSKLHVLADAKGRPIHMFRSAGQTLDDIGARILLSQVPQTGVLLADRGLFRHSCRCRSFSEPPDPR